MISRRALGISVLGAGALVSTSTAASLNADDREDQYVRDLSRALDQLKIILRGVLDETEKSARSQDDERMVRIRADAEFILSFDAADWLYFGKQAIGRFSTNARAQLVGATSDQVSAGSVLRLLDFLDSLQASHYSTRPDVFDLESATALARSLSPAR